MSSLFDDLAAGDCTSCRVTQDKSAYWHPQLYFKDDATGQYEEVEPLGGMLAYVYLLQTFPPSLPFIMLPLSATLRMETWQFLLFRERCEA